MNKKHKIIQGSVNRKKIVMQVNTAAGVCAMSTLCQDDPKPEDWVMIILISGLYDQNVVVVSSVTKYSKAYRDMTIVTYCWQGILLVLAMQDRVELLCRYIDGMDTEKISRHIRVNTWCYLFIYLTLVLTYSFHIPLLVHLV